MAMKIQIICGDCAGNDLKPRRTILVNGRCESCFGRAYELASVMFPPRQWIWREPSAQSQQEVESLINSVAEEKWTIKKD